MLFKYYYWFWQGVLPIKFCEDVIKCGLSKKNELAITGTEKDKLSSKGRLSKKDIKHLKKYRDSNIVFLNEQPIFNVIHDYLKLANQHAGWNFEHSFTESCQFTIYKKNQFYDWHMDSHLEPYENHGSGDSYNGKIRKISCVIQLSDPKKYKGGELEFCFPGQSPLKKPSITTCNEFNTTRGSIIFFPSFVHHRVLPVTSGQRYSLVSWTLGKPYA